MIVNVEILRKIKKDGLYDLQNQWFIIIRVGPNDQLRWPEMPGALKSWVQIPVQHCVKGGSVSQSIYGDPVCERRVNESLNL